MIGQTISHYKILEKLGEGGMGVVYKAQDTKLDRMVALKFLPNYLTSDAQEKERFYHEARATSALMHPNVTVIHEIHEQEGPASAETPPGKRLFLVMELIEGKTLKQLVQGDTLSIMNVLDIIIQCCEGLAAAHEKGIVHRDIKSDNIMMTPKGQVKIMDFGLAKIKGATKLTKTGSTLGTAAYMSPEQAQGIEVDPRSDIFSFGIVCYELLTTKLPFREEHQAALMYSLINEEPSPIARFNEKVSPELERIVSKALAKDRDHRYQHIDEMLADVRREWKQLEYARAGYTTIPSGTAATLATPPKKKTLWITVATLALVGIIATIAVFMFKSEVELNPDLKFRTLQIPFTQIGYPGFSPDGNWITFPAADAKGKWDLYFMNTAGGEPRRITFDSSPSIDMADVSPDGSQIIFDRYGKPTFVQEVCIVSSLGGKSKVLADSAAGARWFLDGRRLGYIRQGTSQRNEYWSIQPDGGDNRLEFVDSSGSSQGRISFSYSQQSSSIAFLRTFPEHGNQEIIVRDLTTGKERQITNDQKNIDEVCWTPNNQIIFSSDRGGNSNLWMVSASGGEAVQITKGSGPDLGIKISADTKKLLYYQRQLVGNLWIANIEHGAASQITFEDRNILTPVLSPDANRIAFVMEDPDLMQLRSHIFVSDRDGGNRRQVTFGNERALVPVWSPHGKWIAYTSYRTKEIFDSAQVYLLDASFHQEPKPVGKGYPLQWIDSTVFISMNMSSNGAWITYADGAPQKQFYVDSTGVGALSEKGFTMKDTRKGREGVWFVPENILNVFDKPDIITSIAVRNDKFPKEWSFSGRSQDGKQRMYLDEKSGELWNFILSSEKKEPVPTKFPGFNASAIVNGISYDGKEIIYVDQRVSGKLIMIENLFK